VAVRAGGRLVQVRFKAESDAAFLALAREAVWAARAEGGLVLVNDRADIARLAAADGVHVGQDDLPVDAVRRLLGPDMLIGLSTHAPEQFGAGLASDADYLSAGPIWETPTKPGRPAAGLDYIRYAASVATKPWFAIGGIDEHNIGEVVAAGARRAVVVRAIRDADDPAAVASALKSVLDRVS
jgi:thiamine-phosphate pyrophosphorylase